jgi:hypothetical protein
MLSKERIMCCCGRLGLLAAVLGAVAVAQGQNIPQVVVVKWKVTRITGLVVYNLSNPAGIPSDTIAGLTHEELDIVEATVRITDADWIPPEDPNQTADYEETFLRFTAVSNLAYAPPEPPPVRQADFDFFPEDEGFRPPETERVNLFFDVPIVFQIPEFVGTNQLRERGVINFDCEWIVTFAVSNEQSPEGAERGRCPSLTVYCAEYPVRAVESPLLAPPNPRPFADAGPDRAVLPNTVVKLDGSRTFDSSNFGFDPNDDVNTFVKDKLTFTWEWISGPERVDPVQTSPRDPVATVVFTRLGDYVYRLTVSDNVNAPPSQDSVTLSVVEKLPANRGPRARITGPPGNILLGTIVTLDGSDSTDPDGDELIYRWEQTNELGGPLDPNDLRRLFQPVSGLTGRRISWQAIREGTFYFRLTVSDGRLSNAANFSVNVINPAVEGAYVVGWASPPPGAGGRSGSGGGVGKEAGGPEAGDLLSEPRGLCGLGSLFGLGFTGLALVTARRGRWSGPRP